jgi:CheY-like chemotaxis protein
MADAPKLLLIDDDQFLLDLYARKFEAGGFSVTKCKSADDALKVLRGGSAPGAVVFDIVMPGTDGFAFLEAMRAEGLARGAAKIALSNENREEDIQKVMALGADGHITKAAAIPSEAVEAVREIMERKRAASAS